MINKNPENPGMDPPNLLLGGVKIKIQSIRNKQDAITRQQKAIMHEKESRKFQGFYYDEEKELPAAEKLTRMLEKKRDVHTHLKTAFSNKRLLIPSFGTTALVFNQHFKIMHEIKYHIERLKQAYHAQMDKKKTWQQVDEIIRVLDLGTQYLDFPED